jgi:hypothetical protein
MQRVVIFGRGAAGKSVLARRLGELTGLPVIELDSQFWHPGLAPMRQPEWTAAEQRLAGQAQWIIDGHLGPGRLPAVLDAVAGHAHGADVRVWRSPRAALANPGIPEHSRP